MKSACKVTQQNLLTEPGVHGEEDVRAKAVCRHVIALNFSISFEHFFHDKKVMYIFK